MRRINLTSVPEELYAALVKEGEFRRETVPATVLRICCDRVLASTPNGHNGNTTPTHPRRAADTRKKFEPPSDAEASTHYRARGYHFDFVKFLATYKGQGWKLGNGNRMVSWEQTMVKWEAEWKEKHPAQREFADVGEILEKGRAAARARGDID